MGSKKDYTHIFEQIAANHHTTVAEVRREMEITIRAGFENPDHEVQAQWAKVPRKIGYGKAGTPHYCY